MASKEPEITPALVASHGLKPDEYARFLKLIGRTPSFTELGIVSAMWNEHCSYKSSKVHLKTLPTTGPQVVYGPGENAGVVDIGDGDVAVFKMESHNHPSYIEPYQGATTGVGGILRDVFTMGARPIAALNFLAFGEPSHPRTKHILGGAVAGIAGYGNSFGVPTVGGGLMFHPRYNGNCLVNAFALGLAKKDAIFVSAAQGVDMPIVYLGSKTGRDGIHGATMASAEFDDKSEEKRPTVQVGDPFAEKLLLEACLEVMAAGAVIAIQDMGAAGLTCSAVEMGAKGNLGVELNLDAVPIRESGMTAYEMMLSESQERMLMVLRPDKRAVAEAIFHKWGLDFAIIGKTTNTLRFVVKHGGEVKADLPIKELGDEAPEYKRPWVASPKRPSLNPLDIKAPVSNSEALLKLLASPAFCSRAYVWEHYDHLIQGNTLHIPGGDAAIIRIGEGPKGLALSTDVTPRYVEADPFEGGKQAVAECWRNMVSVGGKPLALTDNLNFGNPEKPEIMGQFAEAVRGIGEAAKALDFPVVSGNVSLYNETNGQAILPTPTIAGIALVKDIASIASIGLKRDSDLLLLVGETKGAIGMSAYQEIILQDQTLYAPPSVDLALERKNGDAVQSLIASGLVDTVHDLADGGLAIALAEMCMAGNRGALIESNVFKEHALCAMAALYAEDQARYCVAVAPEKLLTVLDSLQKAGVHVTIIGQSGGKALQFGDEAPILVGDLKKTQAAFLPAYMA